MHIPIPGIGGITATPQEYLIWVVILTIILFAVFRAIKDKAFITPSYLKYFLIYLVLILSTAVFNPIKNTDIFVINVLRLIAAFIIWLSLHQFRLGEKEKQGILLIILVSALIESALVIIQPYALTAYIPPVGGAFGQKNLFASWTATGIAISLYFITTERFSGYKNSKKALFFSAAGFMSAGLILASSRAGLLGASIAIITLLTTNWRRYSSIRKHLAIWFLAFALGIGGGFYLLIGPSNSLKSEAEEGARWISDTSQRSYAERLLMYRTSYEMFKQRPLFGQGFSNFSSLYMYHQAEVAKDNPEYKALIHDDISHPHNEFFYILAECGLFGILAIAIALFGIWRILSKTGLSRAGIYAALLIPLIVHMMVEYPLKLSTAHYLLFLILLYMVTSNEVKERELKLGKGAAAAVMLFAGGLYLGTTAYTFRTFEDYVNLVAFNIKFNEEKGVISEEHIKPAMKNIYLRNIALPDYMYKKAIAAASDTEMNKDVIDKFLIWNEAEKLRRPVMKSFYTEGLLFYLIGCRDKEMPLFYFDKALSVTGEGLYLYPNERYLLALKESIISSPCLKAPTVGNI
ncbi:MAG: Wzy polymerase domain-containing protein [Thermodesulfovibrionia bacterium]|nr:Wzy polymerase domain-containing protein [Thermodesulfovibrionia bacterium]